MSVSVIISLTIQPLYNGEEEYWLKRFMQISLFLHYHLTGWISWRLKGQIISKQFLVSSDSSKKQTNEFVFWPNSTKNEFVRSFFGRIRGYQKVLSKLSDLSYLFFHKIQYFLSVTSIVIFGKKPTELLPTIE